MLAGRWSDWKGWVAVGVVAICTFGLLYLVSTTALDKGTALWAKAFLFFIGVSGIAAVLISSDGIPWSSRSVSDWIAPKTISLIFVAIYAAFGTMTDALGLFEPRPAVESRPGIIESNVRAIRDDVRKLAPGTGSQARIWKALPGLWGEPGCAAVTYRFAINDQAVIVTSDKRPAETEPYRMVATILSAKADNMQIRGETPESARGKAASFAYSTNGAVERLIWQDHVANSVPIELDRCA